MKTVTIVTILAIVCSSALAFGPPSPILPQHYTQKFAEGYHYTQYFTSGQVWYDWTQQAERIDRSDGRF